MLSFAHPWVLVLLPLAGLPLLVLALGRDGYPSLDGIPPDPASRVIDWLIRAAGVLAISGLILGLAGLQKRGATVERVGEGAHIVLLFDRSRSMDDTFAGEAATPSDASKSATARKLLLDFIDKRPHDFFGVDAFSTSPIHILPLTDKKDAIRAAINAMDRSGLAYTNVGRGLAMALSTHEADPAAASRAILLVSDGAAVLDRKTQEKLKTEFAKRRINLYWLFLRTAGSPGIFDVPPPDATDTPHALPERHLHKFFLTLPTTYHAFEAENPAAVADAIGEIDKLERAPIRYIERTPHRDLSNWCYSGAALALLLLVIAKLAETRIADGPTPLKPARAA
jgi:mxaC protein